MQLTLNRNFSSAFAAERLGDTDELADFIRQHPKLFVLTGAGISCASGIPAYRDEVGTWRSRTPIHHAEFMREASVRQRYWARSYVGWPMVNRARPNAAHSALVRLEEMGYIETLVTQNIDRLHQQAGQRRVIDLHGRLDQVVCLDCGALSAREQIQHWLAEHNPHLQNQEAGMAPDGDAEVDNGVVSQVQVPRCSRCDGMLQPNVVFYGSSVRKQTVDYLCDRLLSADAVLVIGSSLMVYSSFRFCKLAAERNQAIACINRGLTRGDDLYSLKLQQDCERVLSVLAATLPQRT